MAKIAERETDKGRILEAFVSEKMVPETILEPASFSCPWHYTGLFVIREKAGKIIWQKEYRDDNKESLEKKLKRYVENQRR